MVNDTLEISTIGYKTFKIQIKDFINLEDKTIIIEEDIMQLDDIEILATEEYPKLAVKNIKNTTVRNTFQYNVLYRRSSVEKNVSRFFVEHYLKVKDNGPSSPTMRSIELVEGRKSADYRFLKTKQWEHAIKYMADQNLLRKKIKDKSYTWAKIDDTSYDGESVVIVEGQSKKHKWLRIKLYIGLDNYSIYRFETTLNNAVYIYKKNTDGKLYLSYHKREMKHSKKITPQQQASLRTTKTSMPVAYKHEAFVLEVITDKDKINVKDNMVEGVDMGDMKVPYHPEFWKNFSVPPMTKFYEKIKNDLESLYGVPIKTQFELVN